MKTALKILFIILLIAGGFLLVRSPRLNEDPIMVFVLVMAVSVGVIILVSWVWKKTRVEISNESDAESGEEMIVSDMVTPGPGAKDEYTVPVYKLHNLAEAVTLKSVLESNRIPCIITSFDDLAYDGLYQMQKGWGMLQVLEPDRDRAAQLIKDYLAEQALYRFPPPRRVAGEETGAGQAQLPPDEIVPDNPPEVSEKSLFRTLLFKIVAVIIIGILLGGFLAILIWIIRRVF